VIDVNITGVVATLTAVTERMVDRKKGHLVATSSLAGFRGLPRWAMYSGSKAFVSIFLESLRMDLRSTGVLVTDVRPGYVKTPLTEGATKPMPFLIEVDRAASLIWRGLRAESSIVEFPWPLAAALRASKAMPRALFDPVAKKML
jgi:short-subunit dehydrogenase